VKEREGKRERYDSSWKHAFPFGKFTFMERLLRFPHQIGTVRKVRCIVGKKYHNVIHPNKPKERTQIAEIGIPFVSTKWCAGIFPCRRMLFLRAAAVTKKAQTPLG
jgi:hypothetical protein